MKTPLAVCLVLGLCFFASVAYADKHKPSAYIPPVSAERLDRMCFFFRQALRGSPDNPDAARQCEMYIQSFIDTMNISATLSGIRLYCPARPLLAPDILPALELWIRKHSNKAGQATAAVALLDALRVGYPCPH